LAEIETDKATMEFESFNEGTLLYVGINEGETAPVDSVLAIIGPAGTDVTGIADNHDSLEAASDKGAGEKSDNATTASKEVEATAKVEATTNGGRIFASPLARKIAEEKG
ncbi:biotin/lipoyl-containing protein, partial [Pseudoalteromonas fuliginea]|uniref:biotin/lipoyl-containing protein n=3 Tax=Pseudomonadati TaxID=3379134 RepID=UPI000517C7E9